MTFDILIRNARVCDGTGQPTYPADIGITGDRIVRIGDLQNCSAAQTIDAHGLVAAPGFIDMHSHADCTLLLFPNAQSLLRQGVTTIVGGNCGTSPAPLERVYLMQCWELDFWQELDPFVFYENSFLDLEPVRAYFREHLGYDMDWRSFGEFLNRVEHTHCAVNYVPLVGHGQVRAQVLGLDNARPATAEEADAIAARLRDAMEAGAWGISTGLDYAPGAFADAAELQKAVAAAGAYGGLYATHWRRTGIRKGHGQKRGKIDGILEALSLSEQGGAKLQISHILSGYDIFPATDPDLAVAAVRATLSPIDCALAAGQPVAFDVIPNTGGGIDILPWLVRYFQPWVRQAGSTAGFLRNLRAGDYRDYVKRSIERGDWYLLSAQAQPDWDAKLTVIRSANPDRVGKTIRDLCAGSGAEPLDMLFTLLLEDPDTLVDQKMFLPETVREFLAHPRAMVGSDSFALDQTGIYGLQSPPYIMPHPNTYCAFPNFLLHYASGTLEQAIHQLTQRPAEWLGLPARGTLREGNFADIVLLNPEALVTNESYCEPRNFPGGIDTVLVNGTVAVQGGQETAQRPGRVLRRGQ